MKACICTIPNREISVNSPPFGSLTIIQSLRRIGWDVEFYNIDYFRPKHDEITTYFRENQFDVVGISAVLSTAYSFTKYLSDVIRTASPEAVIVVGGNLAASAEILLRKCKVDFCVVGDGEVTIQDLVKALNKNRWDCEQMKSIKGICFLDRKDQFRFTGYRTPLPGGELDWPDYSILETDGSLQHYIQDTPDWIVSRGLEIPAERYGKRNATVQTAKGCTNRCTFCHRWEKGYRMRPVDQIIEHIKYLKDRYNVGFLDMFDEAFGSDRRRTCELVSHLGELGIIWRAGAVRCRVVDKKTLMHWKANGCRGVTYGVESGSQVMLDVMEKNCTVQMNIDALKWTYDAGMVTTIQLVLGMPGESDKTIQETINFLKQCMPYYSTAFRDRPNYVISMTYAQALPGTPLYEYYREHGFIGKTLDNEEQYLIKVSDVNASDPKHFINSTKHPLLKVRMWPYRISGELQAHYLQYVHGITLSFQQVARDLFLRTLRQLLGKLWPKISEIKLPVDDAIIKGLGTKYESQTKYSNSKVPPQQILFLNSISRRLFYPILVLAVAVKAGDYSPFRTLSIIAEYLRWVVSRKFDQPPIVPRESLRKIINIKPPLADNEGSEEMIPLRKGR